MCGGRDGLLTPELRVRHAEVEEAIGLLDVEHVAVLSVRHAALAFGLRHLLEDAAGNRTRVAAPNTAGRRKK